MEKKPLFEIACPSTEIEGDAVLNGNTLSFQLYSGGELIQDGITFVGVAAIRRRAERCCTAWHIEDFYDTLCEVESSEWVDEIRKDMQPQFREKWALHHFGIYLDSYGCLEVIADSWHKLSGQTS